MTTLVVPEGMEVQVSDGLLTLLGLDDGLGGKTLDAGTYTGDRPVNFARTKTLNVHLEQVKTSQNVINGAPSTLLATVGLGRRQFFGAVNTLRFEHPEFKHLEDGTISELRVVIRDDQGQYLDNHDLPISSTLEISRHD
jgi:hypothetical protein